MNTGLSATDPGVLGSYRLLSRLGSGGMGQVYLGRSPGGRLVAVKVIKPELAADEEFRRRFAREVAAARNVNGMFTAVVADADPEGPVPWLATAYIPGPSLGAAVQESGPLPLPQLLPLAAGLAEALAAIHAAGVVHRDLKPSNVLLAADGPRVIDFGISYAAEAGSLTQTGNAVGSPGYMSPEQARGLPVGPPSDVFSLGAVLTYAATGEGPFGTGTSLALLYRVVHEPAALDRAPPELRPLLRRCLDKNPAARPSPRQLLAMLGGPENWLPQTIAETLSGGFDEDGAAATARAQQGSAEGKAQARTDNHSHNRDFDPPDGQVGGWPGDETNLLFRVYIPKNQLYAEQRREWLRLFREWLVNFQGQRIRQQDIPSRDGDTVAFFAVPGEPRPLLSEEYRDYVSFVEHCAHSPATAVARLAKSGISQSSRASLVTKYAKEYHRMDLDLRQERETRILALQHTLEAELLEKNADPRTIASLRIRSVLEQVVPPPSPAPSLPAIAAPVASAPLTQVNVTFNAEHIVYTAIDSIQGTANFGPQAKELLALIGQYGGEHVGSLRTALHEVEDPEVPPKLRSEATRKLKTFLADLGRQVPGISGLAWCRPHRPHRQLRAVSLDLPADLSLEKLHSVETALVYEPRLALSLYSSISFKSSWAER